MTDLYKRTWFRAAALGLVSAALMVGCGKKEEPKPAPAAEAPKAEPLKIAFAYVGPVGDGGWTFAHDNARKALEAEFGDKIKTSFEKQVRKKIRRHCDDTRLVTSLAEDTDYCIDVRQL